MIFVKKCNQLVQMPGQTFTAIVKDADTNNAKGENVHRKWLINFPMTFQFKFKKEAIIKLPPSHFMCLFAKTQL